MSNLPSVTRITWTGTFEPGSNVELSVGGRPCSRNIRVSDSMFLIRKRGVSVMTLESLYFPSPGIHDIPMWVCSRAFWEGKTISVSQFGASKLIVCPRVCQPRTPIASREDGTFDHRLEPTRRVNSVPFGCLWENTAQRFSIIPAMWITYSLNGVGFDEFSSECL